MCSNAQTEQTISDYIMLYVHNVHTYAVVEIAFDLC